MEVSSRIASAPFSQKTKEQENHLPEEELDESEEEDEEEEEDTAERSFNFEVSNSFRVFTYKSSDYERESWSSFLRTMQVNPCKSLAQTLKDPSTRIFIEGQKISKTNEVPDSEFKIHLGSRQFESTNFFILKPHIVEENKKMLGENFKIPFSVLICVEGYRDTQYWFPHLQDFPERNEAGHYSYYKQFRLDVQKAKEEASRETNNSSELSLLKDELFEILNIRTEGSNFLYNVKEQDFNIMIRQFAEKNTAARSRLELHFESKATFQARRVTVASPTLNQYADMNKRELMPTSSGSFSSSISSSSSIFSSSSSFSLSSSSISSSSSSFLVSYPISSSTSSSISSFSSSSSTGNFSGTNSSVLSSSSYLTQTPVSSHVEDVSKSIKTHVKKEKKILVVDNDDKNDKTLMHHRGQKDGNPLLDAFVPKNIDSKKVLSSISSSPTRKRETSSRLGSAMKKSNQAKKVSFGSQTTTMIEMDSEDDEKMESKDVSDKNSSKWKEYIHKTMEVLKDLPNKLIHPTKTISEAQEDGSAATKTVWDATAIVIYVIMGALAIVLLGIIIWISVRLSKKKAKNEKTKTRRSKKQEEEKEKENIDVSIKVENEDETDSKVQSKGKDKTSNVSALMKKDRSEKRVEGEASMLKKHFEKNKEEVEQRGEDEEVVVPVLQTLRKNLKMEDGVQIEEEAEPMEQEEEEFQEESEEEEEGNLMENEADQEETSEGEKHKLLFEKKSKATEVEELEENEEGELENDEEKSQTHEIENRQQGYYSESETGLAVDLDMDTAFQDNSEEMDSANEDLAVNPSFIENHYSKTLAQAVED